MTFSTKSSRLKTILPISMRRCWNATCGEPNTHREQLEIDPLRMDVTLLKIDVSEQLRRATRAKGQISDNIEFAVPHPDFRDLTVNHIEMDTEIKHGILDTDKEYDLFPQLLQFHQFFAQKQVKSIKDRIKSGEIKLQATGAQIDEKREMMTILDGIYSQFSEKDVTFANIDLKQFDVDLKGEKRELSNVQALDAWFETEDAQDAQREENKPPKVDSVSFSNKSPLLGTASLLRLLDRILKTLTWLGNGLGEAKA